VVSPLQGRIQGGGTGTVAQLVSSIAKDQKRNREALLPLFTRLRFLARQGLATRGHADDG